MEEQIKNFKYILERAPMPINEIENLIVHLRKEIKGKDQKEQFTHQCHDFVQGFAKTAFIK